MEPDIRWEQRFFNFVRALDKLTQAIDHIKHKVKDESYIINDNGLGFVLDEMIKEGLIQRFEYTHELAWNVMKDYAATKVMQM